MQRILLRSRGTFCFLSAFAHAQPSDGHVGTDASGCPVERSSTVPAACLVYRMWYSKSMKAKRVNRNHGHSGSTFDSFLEEQGIREEVEAVAVKRVLAWQLAQAMKKQQKTKQAMARELRTSRSQLDRLLDPQNTAVTLETVTRAAHALGKRLVVRVVDPAPAKPRAAKAGN